MSDNGQPHVLKQIRAMVDSGRVDYAAALPLILAAVADMYEMMSKIEDHAHPVYVTHDFLEDKITRVDRRDWWVIIGAAVVAVTAVLQRIIMP